MQLEMTKAEAIILKHAMKHCVEYYDSISEDTANPKSTRDNAVIYADCIEHLLSMLQQLTK